MRLFVIGSGMALVRLLAIFVFQVILPRLGIVVVRIAEDISVLVVYAAFILARLHFVGLDPSSLLTTSAVITAVLAFAMQDTLGNMLSGCRPAARQFAASGDWIRIDDVTGRIGADTLAADDDPDAQRRSGGGSQQPVDARPFTVYRSRRGSRLAMAALDLVQRHLRRRRRRR
jgi:hypothetical protein